MIAKGVSSKAVVMWEIAVGGWQTAVGVINVSGCDGNSNACVEDNSSGEWLRNSSAGVSNPSEV